MSILLLGTNYSVFIDVVKLSPFRLNVKSSLFKQLAAFLFFFGFFQYSVDMKAKRKCLSCDLKETKGTKVRMVYLISKWQANLVYYWRYFSFTLYTIR